MHLDDAARHAAVARREVSRIHVNALDQTRVHEAREPAEVEKERHGHTVEQRLAFVPSSPAEQRIATARRARDARHHLDRLDGIAAGSGDARERLALDATAHGLVRRRVHFRRRRELFELVRSRGGLRGRWFRGLRTAVSRRVRRALRRRRQAPARQPARRRSGSESSRKAERRLFSPARRRTREPRRARRHRALRSPTRRRTRSSRGRSRQS